MIDFKKAFDTVKHSILVRKLSSLNLPSHIFNWIVSFLLDRTQAVWDGVDMSRILAITRSIIQGSGLGPFLWLLYFADFKLLSAHNILVKFADDTSILSTDQHDFTVAQEFAHLVQWATDHGLLVNLLKTKELVFQRPRLNTQLLPLALSDIQRVQSCKLLGVILNGKLKFNEHVSTILSVINQRFYLITRLRNMGLDRKGLDIIFHSLIVGKVLYALPAIYGFYTKSDLDLIDAVFRKAFRWGITETCYNIQTLADKAEDTLFHSTLYNPQHCLHQLLPDPQQSSYDLRPRGHSYTIPKCNTELYKNSFINRSLCKYK